MYSATSSRRSDHRKRQVVPRHRMMTKENGGTGFSESRRPNHTGVFSAGDTVRESGIYDVIHDREHRSSHEVVMIADDHFPECDYCGDRVKYRVVRTAPYIFSDEDFEEPQG